MATSVHLLNELKLFRVELCKTEFQFPNPTSNTHPHTHTHTQTHTYPAKVQIHRRGADQDKALAELVDPTHLPEFLGGKCHCHGGCVPLLPPPPTTKD